MSKNDMSKTQTFGPGIVNGNSSRMLEAKLYISRVTVHAFELQDRDTMYHSWGIQEMVPGDYVLVDFGTESRTRGAHCIKRDDFQETYEKIPGTNNRFRKKILVRAQRMERPFFVISHDSDQPEIGNAGDWLIENVRDDGVQDRYLIESEKFNISYELAE